jgi:hypothetical protein
MYLPDAYSNICLYDPYTNLFDTCTDLYKIKHLFYIYDYSFKKTSDVSSLRDKHNVDLTGSCVADLSVLKNVRRLTLSYCVNTDTDERLNTDSPEYRMGYMFKLPQIQLLSNLCYINLSYCKNLNDVSPISHVQSINLSYSDISDVTPLSSVHTLSLYKCMNVTDISALNKVQELNISYTNITNIDCLTEVQVLYIYGCEIETPIDCMRCIMYGKHIHKLPVKLEHVDKSLSAVMTQRNLDAISTNIDDDIYFDPEPYVCGKLSFI